MRIAALITILVVSLLAPYSANAAQRNKQGVVIAGNDGNTHRAKDTRHYSHNDFRALVADKTQKEVLKLLGRPDNVQDYGQIVMWTYTGKTFDAVTKNVDTMAIIMFENGVVSNVSFM